MANPVFDLLVIGGGVNGAAIARDGAGRGLKVMLAEAHDYAGATSSSSSNLIHGGLRYLESYAFGFVRKALIERDILQKTAPYLVRPIRFLIPITEAQARPAWMMHLGLKIYGALGANRSPIKNGWLATYVAGKIPHLNQQGLMSVLQYGDCQTDDSRLVMALLLDARNRGAHISNRCEITHVMKRPEGFEAEGFEVEILEEGSRRSVSARFVVNASGPWANRINDLTDFQPKRRNLRLVRGSHIVLPMPKPAFTDAFTLPLSDGRIVFAMPWNMGRFLVLGTTDIPHDGDPAKAECTAEEARYLLGAFNQYFKLPSGPLDGRDIVATWSGVRPLVDDGPENPSAVTRDHELTFHKHGAGGYITVYGGKLTTHRVLAEEVFGVLGKLHPGLGRSWTKTARLFGCSLSLAQLMAYAEAGPEGIAIETRRRWAMTYGDQMLTLFNQLGGSPERCREIIAGVPEVELIHCTEMEDARSAHDFLRRRTKLFAGLCSKDEKRLSDWFGA